MMNYPYRLKVHETMKERRRNEHTDINENKQDLHFFSDIVPMM